MKKMLEALWTHREAACADEGATSDVLVLPGVGDARGRLAAQKAGFPAVYLAGTKVAERVLGEADEGLVSPSEMAWVTRHVKEAAGCVPVLADAQSGFGNQLTAHFAVLDLVRAGADGVVVSDQAFPAHTDVARVSVGGADEFAARLRAARDACESAGEGADLALVAKLDGLGAEGGYDLVGAVSRAMDVCARGLADAVLVSVPAERSVLDQLGELAGRLGLPVGAAVRGGVTDRADELVAAARDAGLRFVVMPNVCTARVSEGAMGATDAAALLAGAGAVSPQGAKAAPVSGGANEPAGAPAVVLGRDPSDADKPTRMRAAFRKMCFSGDLVRMIVAPDALAARIAESVGFKAIFAAGYATSASRLAMPDRGIADFGLLADNARAIIDAVDIPVFLDGDTGYGDEANIARMVRVYEDMGAAGLFIEDQVWPKRCGHMDGKAVVSREEGVARVAAAAAARRHDDFLIMSRTDAYASYRLDEAIARTRAYHEAGADLCFIEAPKTVEDMRRIPQLFHDAPLMANMIESGKTPLMSDEEIHEAGFTIAVHPCGVVYTEAFAEHRLLSDMLRSGGDMQADIDQMITFPQFNEFVGLDEINAMERSYAQGE